MPLHAYGTRGHWAEWNESDGEFYIFEDKGDAVEVLRLSKCQKTFVTHATEGLFPSKSKFSFRGIFMDALYKSCH